MDNELEIFARRARIAGADGEESQPPPVDTTPPGLRLQTRPRQRLRRDRTVVLRATCDESCTLSPRVTITIAGRRRAIRRTGIVRPLAGAATTPIRLRLRRKQAAAVRRALRRGRRATATFHAKAIDAAGNGASKRARSRLIRAGSAGVR
jgi:hypothetical protein